MLSPVRALPKGSWVLVLGANGYIASHIILEFLKLGYKVRGTVRDISTSSWLTEELFKSQAASGSFELVAVPDLTAENAFSHAVRRVSAVVEVVFFRTYDPDPNNSIPQSVSATLNLLRAAAKETSVKRFVQTSSVGAAIMPNTNPSNEATSTSWNEAATEAAWAPPPYEAKRAPMVYMAAKVAREKALWKFVEEEKPPFVTNTVLPFWTLGSILNKNQGLSSTQFLRMVYNGDRTKLSKFGAYSYINVRDVALMHVAAVLDPEVQNERIYAVAEHSNWNDVLAIMRKMNPERKFMDDIPDLGKYRGTIDNTLGLKLLRKWGGQDGWTPLEQGIKENLESAE